MQTSTKILNKNTLVCFLNKFMVINRSPKIIVQFSQHVNDAFSAYKKPRIYSIENINKVHIHAVIYTSVDQSVHQCTVVCIEIILLRTKNLFNNKFF